MQISVWVGQVLELLWVGVSGARYQTPHANSGRLVSTSILGLSDTKFLVDSAHVESVHVSSKHVDEFVPFTV